jgi:hypothetical protein
MIQEARMAVPPEKGAQVNADETLLPGAIEDAASTESFLPASHQGMFMRELDKRSSTRGDQGGVATQTPRP